MSKKNKNNNKVTLKDPLNKNLKMVIKFQDGILTFNRVEKVSTELNPLNTNS